MLRRYILNPAIYSADVRRVFDQGNSKGSTWNGEHAMQVRYEAATTIHRQQLHTVDVGSDYGMWWQ
jgi:hypothetical protein